MARLLAKLLLLVILSCWNGRPAAAGVDVYTIPEDAIRIGAEELSAVQLTDHLAGLIGKEELHHGRLVDDSIDHQDNRVDDFEDETADDHLPTALVRLNALLRAAEERKERFESSAATSARLLSINRGGFFRGLLVVWVPVSFLLPTFARRRPTYDRGRSIRTKPSYDPRSSDYTFESHYGPLLSRLDAYFSLMKIDQLDCRWKLVCHVSQQPDVYQPLSNLFGRLFQSASKQQINQQTYHPALKKFFTYVWANKKGSRFKSADQCDREYQACRPPVDQLIRMDMIRFWQKLSKRFAIQLQDE